jgi:hypothetical protein
MSSKNIEYAKAKGKVIPVLNYVIKPYAMKAHREWRLHIEQGAGKRQDSRRLAQAASRLTCIWGQLGPRPRY